MKKLVSKCLALMAVAVLGSCSTSGTYLPDVDSKTMYQHISIGVNF